MSRVARKLADKKTFSKRACSLFTHVRLTGESAVVRAHLEVETVTSRRITIPRMSSGALLRAGVMAVSTALISTLALPAYASDYITQGQSQLQNSAQTTYVREAAQQVTVSEDAATLAATRDSYEISAAVRAITSSSGASYRSVMSNPPNPNFSLSGIFAEGMKYIGTPYIYAGSSPAGFDCSGFTMYVYGTFGVALPHSSEAQRAMGTEISEADAQPGDIVWMYGHVGLWGGPGMILDAPVPGGTVQLRRLWTSDYKIIRIGI